MDEEAVNLFRALTESFGPAGFEREPEIIVKEYMSKYADELLRDKLGSVIFKKRGTSETPRVLLAGHVDEVGFIVSGIDRETGFLSFNPLGGWFDQVLLAQRVVVRTSVQDLPGVIASKPPHLLTPDELEKVVKKDKMFIDIGSTSRTEVEKMGVKVGDPVVPWSPFSLIMNGRVAMGKAFDDRVGAFIAMQTVRRIREERMNHPNTVYGAATVMEEVGLRGATTVPHVVDPDIGIVLEVDISGDVPDIKPQQAPSKMGKGPAIVTFDSSMIPNLNLKEFVIRVAEQNGIPYQLSFTARGGTDAGRIHIHKMGCPSIVIGVPTRHIHSHVSMLSLEDCENTIKLTLELVKRLDRQTVDGFTAL
ncbi:MAG: M42 family metallopeptidase [archaeon]